MRSKATAMTDEPTAPTEAEIDTAANTGSPVPPEATSGSDVPPDRLAISPRSRHFDADKLQRGIGIRFKDSVRTNVEEYSISEGWIRVQAGKTKDRNGQPLTIKLSGPVEAWYEDLGEDAPVAKKG
jgi:hypothetical protein